MQNWWDTWNRTDWARYPHVPISLVNRKYIRYSGKYIVPTPKGMFTYETIRGKKIADTSLTADWEKQLAGLESGMITGQDFLNRIRTLAKEMTDDIFNTYSTKEE